jgi:hypothetical protein
MFEFEYMTDWSSEAEYHTIQNRGIYIWLCVNELMGKYTY